MSESERLDPLAMAIMDCEIDEEGKEDKLTNAVGQTPATVTSRPFDIINVTSLANVENVEEENTGHMEPSNEEDVMDEGPLSNDVVSDTHSDDAVNVIISAEEGVNTGDDSSNINEDVDENGAEYNVNITPRNTSNLALNPSAADLPRTNSTAEVTNALATRSHFASNSSNDISYVVHPNTSVDTVKDAGPTRRTAEVIRPSNTEAWPNRDHSYSRSRIRKRKTIDERLKHLEEQVQEQEGGSSTLMTLNSNATNSKSSSSNASVSRPRVLGADLLLSASVWSTLSPEVPSLELPLHLLCFASGSLIFPSSSKQIFERFLKASKKGKAKLSFFKTSEERASSDFVRIIAPHFNLWIFKPRSIKDVFESLADRRNVFLPNGALSKMNDYATKRKSNLLARVCVQTKSNANWQTRSVDLKLIRAAEKNRGDKDKDKGKKNMAMSKKKSSSKSVLKSLVKNVSKNHQETSVATTTSAIANCTNTKPSSPSSKPKVKSWTNLGSFDIACTSLSRTNQYELLSTPSDRLTCETCALSFTCVHMFIFHFVVSSICRSALSKMRTGNSNDFRTNLAALIAKQFGRGLWASLKCSACDKVLFGPLAYCLHRDEHRRDDGRLFGCPVCGHIFLTAATFFGHDCIRNWKPSMLSENNCGKNSRIPVGRDTYYSQLNENERRKILRCPFCFKRFSFVSKLLKHFRQSSEGSCLDQLLPLFRSASKTGVALHEFNLTKDLNCDRCNLKCSTSMSYVFHMDHHQEQLQCDRCHGQFASVCSFYDHQCFDKNQRNQNCIFCDVYAPQGQGNKATQNEMGNIALVDLTAEDDEEGDKRDRGNYNRSVYLNANQVDKADHEMHNYNRRDDSDIIEYMNTTSEPGSNLSSRLPQPLKRRKTTSIESSSDENVLPANFDLCYEQRHRTSSRSSLPLRPVVKMEGFLCLDCDPYRILCHAQALTKHCVEWPEHDLIKPLSFYNRLHVRLEDVGAMPEHRQALFELLKNTVQNS